MAGGCNIRGAAGKGCAEGRVGANPRELVVPNLKELEETVTQCILGF